MNEKLKRGKQIWENIEKDFDQISCTRDFNQEERLSELENEIWIPYKWLKQEIFNRHRQKLSCNEDSYYNKALGDIIILLEG